MNPIRRLTQLTLVLVLASLSGCYYVQATRGQIEVLAKREPIDEILESPETPAELSERLSMIREARRFWRRWRS